MIIAGVVCVLCGDPVRSSSEIPFLPFLGGASCPEPRPRARARAKAKGTATAESHGHPLFFLEIYSAACVQHRPPFPLPSFFFPSLPPHENKNKEITKKVKKKGESRVHPLSPLSRHPQIQSSGHLVILPFRLETAGFAPPTHLIIMNSLSIIDPVKKATTLSNISRLPHSNIAMMPQSNEKEREQSLPSATNELSNVSHGPCCWLLCIDRSFFVWSSFR